MENLRLNELVKMLDYRTNVTVFNADKNTKEFEGTVNELRILIDEADIKLSTYKIDEMVILNSYNEDISKRWTNILLSK